MGSNPAQDAVFHNNIIKVIIIYNKPLLCRNALSLMHYDLQAIPYYSKTSPRAPKRTPIRNKSSL